jgi:hypothetical protein
MKAILVIGEKPAAQNLGNEPRLPSKYKFELSPLSDKIRVRFVLENSECSFCCLIYRSKVLDSANPLVGKNSA